MVADDLDPHAPGPVEPGKSAFSSESTSSCNSSASANLVIPASPKEFVGHPFPKANFRVITIQSRKENKHAFDVSKSRNGSASRARGPNLAMCDDGRSGGVPGNAGSSEGDFSPLALCGKTRASSGKYPRLLKPKKPGVGSAKKTRPNKAKVNSVAGVSAADWSETWIAPTDHGYSSGSSVSPASNAKSTASLVKAADGETSIPATCASMQDKSGSGRETAGSKTAPTTAQEEALLRKAFEEAQFEGKPVGVTAPAEEERRKVLLRQKDLDLELILGRTRPLQHCSPPKALRSVDGKDRVEPNPSMLRCELRRRLSADYKGVKESKDDHRDAKDGKDASVLRDMPRDARDAYFVPDAETERLESDGNPAPQITAAPPNGVQRSGSAIDFTHDVIGSAYMNASSRASKNLWIDPRCERPDTRRPGAGHVGGVVGGPSMRLGRYELMERRPGARQGPSSAHNCGMKQKLRDSPGTDFVSSSEALGFRDRRTRTNGSATAGRACSRWSPCHSVASSASVGTRFTADNGTAMHCPGTWPSFGSASSGQGNGNKQSLSLTDNEHFSSSRFYADFSSWAEVDGSLEMMTRPAPDTSLKRPVSRQKLPKEALDLFPPEELGLSNGRHDLRSSRGRGAKSHGVSKAAKRAASSSLGSSSSDSTLMQERKPSRDQHPANDSSSRESTSSSTEPPFSPVDDGQKKGRSSKTTVSKPKAKAAADAKYRRGDRDGVSPKTNRRSLSSGSSSDSASTGNERLAVSPKQLFANTPADAEDASLKQSNTRASGKEEPVAADVGPPSSPTRASANVTVKPTLATRPVSASRKLSRCGSISECDLAAPEWAPSIASVKPGSHDVLFSSFAELPWGSSRVPASRTDNFSRPSGPPSAREKSDRGLDPLSRAPTAAPSISQDFTLVDGFNPCEVMVLESVDGDRSSPEEKYFESLYGMLVRNRSHTPDKAAMSPPLRTSQDAGSNASPSTLPAPAETLIAAHGTSLSPSLESLSSPNVAIPPHVYPALARPQHPPLGARKQYSQASASRMRPSGDHAFRSRKT